MTQAKNIEKNLFGEPTQRERDNATSNKSKKGKKDLSNNLTTKYVIEIECVNETQQEQMYNALCERGFKCTILTL